MRSRDSGAPFPASAARIRSTRLSASGVSLEVHRGTYAPEADRFAEGLRLIGIQQGWSRLPHGPRNEVRSAHRITSEHRGRPDAVGVTRGSHHSVLSRSETDSS